MPTAALVSVALLLFPGPAAAHLVSTRFGELYSGMLHPVTSLQHLVPWIALGLLSGLQSPKTARWALPAFPAGTLAGLCVAELLPGIPVVAGLNLASFVILGLLVALKVQFDKSLFVTLVLLVGIGHGYANATPDLHGFPWLLYTTGVSMAAYLSITLVTGLAHALASERSWGSIAVRAAGSWVAAAGAMYGGFLIMAR
jgi:hydrogenase/urease accessory protein HupE